MHTARTWCNFKLQTQGKKFARVATACVHTRVCPGVCILRGHGATFKIQSQGKKFARVRKTRREPNLNGSDGNLRNATLEQISNDMGHPRHADDARKGFDGGWSCHNAFFVSPPPRHLGGTRQVLTDGLPYSVCVSFNYLLRVFSGFICTHETHLLC